jgi:hypothetical protein
MEAVVQAQTVRILALAVREQFVSSGVQDVHTHRPTQQMYKYKLIS